MNPELFVDNKPDCPNEDYQYDHLSQEYASLAQIDPNKQYLQYPEALRLLGDLRGKSVLDIGCGDGTFTRIMARGGARVIAYDPSISQIKEALRSENQEHLGIHYFVGDRPSLRQDTKIDLAVSVMVLLYAPDRRTLADIFRYAFDALDDGGSFISITFNPGYRRLGHLAHNRRFSKCEDGRMQVEFFDEQGKPKMAASFTEFTKADYEEAARLAGFSKLIWEPLEVSQAGIEATGADFWQGMDQDPPYVGLRVIKC